MLESGQFGGTVGTICGGVDTSMVMLGSFLLISTHTDFEGTADSPLRAFFFFCAILGGYVQYSIYSSLVVRPFAESSHIIFV